MNEFGAFMELFFFNDANLLYYIYHIRLPVLLYGEVRSFIRL